MLGRPVDFSRLAHGLIGARHGQHRQIWMVCSPHIRFLFTQSKRVRHKTHRRLGKVPMPLRRLLIKIAEHH